MQLEEIELTRYFRSQLLQIRHSSGRRAKATLDLLIIQIEIRCSRRDVDDTASTFHCWNECLAHLKSAPIVHIKEHLGTFGGVLKQIDRCIIDEYVGFDMIVFYKLCQGLNAWCIGDI